MSNFDVKWQVFISSFIEKGAYRQVLLGLGNTMQIAVFGLLIGIIIGTIIAIIKIVPSKNKVLFVLKKLAALYVNFFRGTPIVVQLLLGYYVLFPLLNMQISSLLVCVIIFGFNSGAYVSEIMRGGILSVDPGQTEAGRAIGLTYGTTMLKIVVPQAIKNIIPTLGNEFIALLKETSVAGYVAVVDLTRAGNLIRNNTYDATNPLLIVAAVYLILVIMLTQLLGVAERKLSEGYGN